MRLSGFYALLVHTTHTHLYKDIKAHNQVLPLLYSCSSLSLLPLFCMSLSSVCLSSLLLSLLSLPSHLNDISETALEVIALYEEEEGEEEGE